MMMLPPPARTSSPTSETMAIEPPPTKRSCETAPLMRIFPPPTARSPFTLPELVTLPPARYRSFCTVSDDEKDGDSPNRSSAAKATTGIISALTSTTSKLAPENARDLFIYRHYTPRFFGRYRCRRLPVRTPRPAAGAAHAASELRNSLLDTDIPRLRFFARSNPANPLVARKRRNVFPHRPRRRRLNQGLSQILRHFMYCATNEPPSFSHTDSLSKPTNWGWYKVRTFIIEGAQPNSSSCSR